MKVVAAFSLASVATALVVPNNSITNSTNADTESLIQTTDKLLFKTSMSDFLAAREAEDPKELDWTSDGCTDAPSNSHGFTFDDACYRRDFGYQNGRAQSRFTEAYKSKVDSNFLKDLQGQCKQMEITVLKTCDKKGSCFPPEKAASCMALAKTYHAAVVKLGGQDVNKQNGTEPAGTEQGGDDDGLGDDQDSEARLIAWLKKHNGLGSYVRGHVDMAQKDVDTDVL